MRIEYISQAKIKQFTALKRKKYRYRERLFIVEGRKMVEEAIREGVKTEAIIIPEGSNLHIEYGDKIPVFLAPTKTFSSLSSLENPEGIMGVFHFPDEGFIQMLPTLKETILQDGSGIILDQIQDPGNLGTIIRLADWFGIKHIVCLKGTVDPLNPKVLRSSMGAIFRTNVYLTDQLGTLSKKSLEHLWVADMEGQALEQFEFPRNSWILLGNEANGVSNEVHSVISKKVTIEGAGKTESLNVGIAAGILAYKLYLSNIGKE